MSQESRDAVFAVLTKHYAEVGITIVNNLSDLEALVARRPDLVFLGMNFVPVNPDLGLRDPAKIWITKYLDDNNISYTGSNQMAHELERNKPLAKQRVLDAGLKTSPFYVAKQNQPQTRENVPLAFPLFIKPTSRGGGAGINSDSVVHNLDQLESKVLSIATNQQSDSLIEEYLPGREFSVAILKKEHSAEFSVMPIELIAQPDKQGSRILSKQVKSSNTEHALAITDKIIKDRVNTLAINAFYALRARDYGRVDIRLDKTGTPQFLEANLIPSLISGYGSFPKACLLNIGMDYEPMILSIVRLGLARNLNVSENNPEPNAANNIVLPPFEDASESV
ncbi:MAG: hypothetical protein Q8P54_00410 [bacterium]|nr:hypothetical protein [bacterium]